jgi:hypothetical protein
MPRHLLESDLARIERELRLPRDFTRAPVGTDEWIEAVEIDDA